MSRWDYEAAQAAGFPEDFLAWYGDYLRMPGGEPVSKDVAYQIWNSSRPAPAEYKLVPEGTQVASRDAGANAANIEAARDIPDATARLDELMADSERKHGHEQNNTNLDVDKFEKYIDLVKDKAEYDLKRKPEWKSDQYIYNGEVVDNDVPGNISYGYLGKVFGYPEWFITKGAGGYQIKTDLKNTEKRLGDIIRQFNWDSFGDDPRDTARIRQGIELYNKKHGRGDGGDSSTLEDLFRAVGY